MKTQFNSRSRAAGPAHSATKEPTWELARRRTGSDEVLLLWLPVSNTVELRIDDLTTRESFGFRIPSDEAMRAFRHPYAYAATAERSVSCGRASRPARAPNQTKGTNYA
jgi:hypothetical protein